MDDITDIFKKIDLTKIKAPMIDDNGLDELTAKYVNALFKELVVLFPAFKQSWTNDEMFLAAKRCWTKAFMEAELNDNRLINIGLRRFRQLKNPFVPTPGQFIAMCIPTLEELGLPNIHVAYKEACLNSHPSAIRNWSHKAIYHAWVATGSSTFTSMDARQSFPIFERNYEIIARRMLNGENLKDAPVIEKALPSPKDITRPSSTGVAREAFKAMFKELGVSR